MTFSDQEEWVRTYPSCRNATFSLLSSTANSITCIKSAICILLASQNQHLQINRWRRKGSFWFPKSWWPKITKIPKLLLDSSSLTFEELGQLERFKLVWPIQSTPLSQTSNWKINPIHNSVSPIINGQAADIYLKDFELTTVVLLKEKYLPSPSRIWIYETPLNPPDNQFVLGKLLLSHQHRSNISMKFIENFQKGKSRNQLERIFFSI
jgi:hypothetical protein